MATSSSSVSTGDAIKLYEKFVNPQWVRLLDVLRMNVSYEHCAGCELRTTDGRILNFNCGYCVHNAGHNHPRIRAALKAERDGERPAMLQSKNFDSAFNLDRLDDKGGEAPRSDNLSGATAGRRRSFAIVISW